MSEISEEIIHALDLMPLFIGVSRDHLRELAKLATILEVQANEVLVAESDMGDKIFAIISGRVDIRMHTLGSMHYETIAQIKNGEVLGEAVLLGKTRRNASAMARDSVIALSWSGGDMLDYFEKHQGVGYEVMRNLARIVFDRLSATNMSLRNALNGLVDVYER